MENRKPILVTGPHRSGSTWVGKMISLSPEVGYIWEPFNKYHRPGVFRPPVHHWFPYFSSSDRAMYGAHFRKTLAFKYGLFAEIASIRTLWGIVRLVWDCSRFAYYRVRDVRPLAKDPMALFLAEWLARYFRMDTVVCIRHPAAFIGSLKRKDWRFDFHEFLNQPRLMKERLDSFREDMERCTADDVGIIEEGILLWRIFHHVILSYQEQHKEWYFVRNEDLSRDPVTEFKVLFDHLKLPFTQSVSAKIRKHTSSEAPSIDGKTASVCRNSVDNITAWKHLLTEREITRIYDGVADIAPRFYTDGDW